MAINDLEYIFIDPKALFKWPTTSRDTPRVNDCYNQHKYGNEFHHSARIFKMADEITRYIAVVEQGHTRA